MQVRKANLGQLTFLAEGGFGQVYRADEFNLPGDATALAYKEFTSEHARQGASARSVVAFRNKLSLADRTELDSYCAWPRALVEDDHGSVCGLLMPLIPPDFFCRMSDPDTGKPTSKPREMGWLIASAAQRREAKIDLPEIEPVERLLLLARLVYAVARLHKHNWVFGDLSFKNAVFALDPPRVMLLDCDGAADLGDLNRHQASSPYWDPPECPLGSRAARGYQQDVQDAVTDTYKLGLAILRCLTPGKGAGTTKNPGRLGDSDVLGGEGTGLVTRALSEDRASRPTAKELYLSLRDIVRQHVTPPRILRARLAETFLLRGQSARIEWQISNAERVTVSVGASYTTAADLTVHASGFTFPAAESGPVRIEAVNRFGTVTADLGEITFIELPPFTVSFDNVPQPTVPPLQTFSLAPVNEVLTGDSDARRGAPAVPPIPPVDITGFFEGFAVGGPGTHRIVPDVPPVPSVDITSLFKNVLADGSGPVTWQEIDLITNRVTAGVWTQLEHEIPKHFPGQQKDRR